MASHGTDFHQFMLYTPVPAIPLYQQMTEQERMLDDVERADIHCQFKLKFRQAAISRDESKQFLDGAFRQDFEENGPSLSYLPDTLQPMAAVQGSPRGASSRTLCPPGAQASDKP